MENGVKGRVLCVEDNTDECELVREILNEYDVTCVATIEEARRVLETARFDLAIIDEHLPDGSGMALCGQLKKEKRGTPCILVSGDTFLTVNEAQSAGARALLVKSMVDYIEELQMTVNRYARSAHA